MHTYWQEHSNRYMRGRNKLPLRKSLKRNWEKEQMEVYEDAGEYDLADEFRENLQRKHQGEHARESVLPVGTTVVNVPIPSHPSNGSHSNRKEGSTSPH